jgi:uncharacterized protein (TIGR02996 family)
LLVLLDHPELRVEKPETPRTASGHEGLLRAIFRDSADDTPRLVFADFLDENGQPDRAALIRLQCDLARRKPTKAQLDDEKKLVAKVRKAHVDPLPQGYTATFERGFLTMKAVSDYQLSDMNALPNRFMDLFRGGWVEKVLLSSYGWFNPKQLALFCQAGVLDTSSHPVREEGLLVLAAEVDVGTEGARLSRVIVHPSDEPMYRAFTSNDAKVRLPRTPRMNTAQGTQRAFAQLTSRQLGLLVRSGRLEGLETLSLEGPIGDGGAAILANTEDLRLMRSLTLIHSQLSAEGARGLVALGLFPSLCELTLNRATTESDAFVAMVQGSGLACLTALTVLNEPLGERGVLALANATHFDRLETLRLQGTGATTKAITRLLTNDRFRSLIEVHLDEDDIRPTSAVRVVVEASPRPNLQLSSARLLVTRTMHRGGMELIVERQTQRGPVVDGAFAAAKAAKDITSLTMRNVGLRASTIPALAAGLSPEKLHTLNLTQNALGNEGVQQLATEFHDYRPQTLNLSRVNVRPGGIVALAASRLLMNVRTLDISHNNLGFHGVNAIAHSPHLGELKQLRLQGTNLDPDEWREIEKKLGKKAVL